MWLWPWSQLSSTFFPIGATPCHHTSLHCTNTRTAHLRGLSCLPGSCASLLSRPFAQHSREVACYPGPPLLRYLKDSTQTPCGAPAFQGAIIGHCQLPLCLCFSCGAWHTSHCLIVRVDCADHGVQSWPGGANTHRKNLPTLCLWNRFLPTLCMEEKGSKDEWGVFSTFQSTPKKKPR